MSSSPLFRSEVVLSQQVSLEGRIILPSQANLTWLATAGVFLLIGLMAYSYWGEYTRKAKLVGVVMPAAGLLKIVSPRDASVLTLLVKEGQEVQEGTPLFIVSGERYNREGQGTVSSLRGSIKEEINLLSRERMRRKEQNQLASRALLQHQQTLFAQQSAARRALAITEQRANLQKGILSRNMQLLAKGFISASALQQHEIEVAMAQGDVEQQQQNLIGLQQSLQEVVNDQKQSSLQGQNELAELERSIKKLEQQLLELGSQDASMIRAPANGIVTGILAKPGQTLRQNELMLALVPRDAELLVELYATSQSVGFIKPGQPVGIRFNAFPYEKYGIQKGRVKEVARVAQVQSELIQRTLFSVQDSKEVYYRVLVELLRTSVSVNGKEEPLKVGMSTEGDVSLDTRRIYEWLFEPIASFRGH
ncbi:HlyD family efflux transporter periplasmic adaptor subunit [Iodobacter sp. HSC-16F04]|uniref:HlyD family efflux transporter periplasmic adaptor subunit n=1 Tax=Iodobacter violaceini TaxID=3044271 RepID=A0ABX0KNE3_9NEIS|nr:HlyD family efflux transporter periplasmic adaptor subunit [Iodobacter violacea]NHQ85780.1 HlyD family efflux transporter periplasmic adaptor subunit [Iodobacter violacea]